jgi:hypothetical protein
VSFVENRFHSRSFMNPAPEGRPSLAQRFSAGKGRGYDSSLRRDDRVLIHIL